MIYYNLDIATSKGFHRILFSQLVLDKMILYRIVKVVVQLQYHQKIQNHNHILVLHLLLLIGFLVHLSNFGLFQDVHSNVILLY